MATALFVTTKDLKRYSVLSGNIDPDKFVYMIEISMDTEVQIYLGTKLYQKLQDLIIAGTINDPANASFRNVCEANDYLLGFSLLHAFCCLYSC